MSRLIVLADSGIESCLNQDADTPAQLWIPSGTTKRSTEVFPVLVLTEETSESSILELCLSNAREENMVNAAKINIMQAKLTKFERMCDVVGGEAVLFDLVREFKTAQIIDERQAKAGEQLKNSLSRMKP